ncbi:exocyst complex component 3 4 [Pelobates cultripes]|uniref:Exocyst complex component 3 4 n=1 Tax=Pelobates cultripes TaxID=61616 RepID=A0AAD1WY15_PELCU|nr:exocyst complex component 3 4 [Pelobates cultripes]
MEEKDLNLDFSNNKRSSQISTLDSPDDGSPGKGTFLKSLSFRLSKRNSKKKDTQEEPGSPEKKETTDLQHVIGNKLRNSFRSSRKKLDINSSDNKCDNMFVNGETLREEPPQEKEILSVMEINEIITQNQLERAFGSIQVMEDNLLKEYKKGIYKSNESEYKRKAKDVDMLYDKLFKQMTSIVKNSLVQEDQMDEQMVRSVVHIIDEESKKNRKLSVEEAKLVSPSLGIPRKWKTLWKGVIKENAMERVRSVPMASTTERRWLADHLELLNRNIVQDLLKVKNSLKPLYPDEYDVFGTYVRSFNDSLSSHITGEILSKSLTFSQMHGLLDWVLNIYISDSFMGHPDINVTKLSLLDDECIQRLKSDYQSELQMTGNHIRESAKLSKDLETPTFHVCMGELSTFTERLVSEFTSFFSGSFTGLFVQYLVIYVNSFLKLRNNPNQSDAEPCTQAVTSIDNANDTLKKHFFKVFSSYTLPYFKKLITKKWLSQRTDFNAIIKSTKEQCQYLKYLIAPLDKEFVNDVHKHLVKGYLTEIMKRKMSLTMSQRKKASQIMNQEGTDLNSAVQDLGSAHEYLFSAIHCIAEIICLRKREEIQSKLDILYQTYPDISDEHIFSIFHLQGIRRSKKTLLMNYFRGLQRMEPHPPPNQTLFSEIENSTRTTCF